MERGSFFGNGAWGDVFHGTPRPTIPLRIGNATANVEVASTEEEIRRGLMFRRGLAPDSGMLFVHRDEAPREFWMGNTLIPLDIAFFASDGTLLNVVGTPTYPDPLNPPQGYPTARSKGPARFVLEMNLGWFRRRGLVDERGVPNSGVRADFPF